MRWDGGGSGEGLNLWFPCSDFMLLSHTDTCWSGEKHRRFHEDFREVLLVHTIFEARLGNSFGVWAHFGEVNDFCYRFGFGQVMCEFWLGSNFSERLFMGPVDRWILLENKLISPG